MPAKQGVAGSRLVSLGSSPPREYSLDKPIVAIGSHPPNDVVLADTTVSRRHAVITRKANSYELTDIGSTNGTFVNGRRVQKAVALKAGDLIKFGSVRYAFDPPSVPARLRRVFVILAAMFIAGFIGARYRSGIGPASSAIVAWISSHRSAASPSAINTQSASAKTEASANSEATAANPAATEGSTPASAPIPASAEPEWLGRVNFYRAMVKLPPIVEDPELSKGDRAHTIYIVKNYHDAIMRGGLGAEMHTEDPGKPNYTPAGLDAAKSSDIEGWSTSGGSSDASATSEPGAWSSPAWTIDQWMAIPFHRMQILNPRLTSAGFALYCEAEACAAGLDLKKGAQGKMPAGAAASLPIEFPPEGGSVAIRSLQNEWPNPLTSCPGFAPPSGLAITLQLGTWMDTHLGDYSIARLNPDGSHTPVEACGFDSTRYSNPDAHTQDVGRNILKSYGTVVLIPRAPLDKGAKYEVQMSANGKQYGWTFSTSP